MLIEVEGDLLLSRADAIAHVVAPNDDFHNGLALGIREQWPALYKDFRHYCRQTHPASGGIWAWKGPGTGVIYSLMAQDAAVGQGSHPGAASLPALSKCLGALRQACDREKHKTLAMSRLATGVGGLSWQDVQPMIARHFGDSSMRVYVYSTYRKDLKATED